MAVQENLLGLSHVTFFKLSLTMTHIPNSVDRRVWPARECLLRRHLPLHDLHRPLLLPHCQQVHAHHPCNPQQLQFSGPAMVQTFTMPTKPSMTWVRQDENKTRDFDKRKLIFWLLDFCDKIIF